MSKQQQSQPADKAVKQEKKNDDDLTTILDESQRADLTLLIANATESMRKLLIDNFDASAGLDKSLLREGMSEDEKLMSADPATADVEKYDRERKLKEEYEKDLKTLKMKNLKKNSLKAFDEWRESVIMRVGQVVNSERVAKDQLEKESGAESSRPQAPNTIGKIVDVPKRGGKLKFKDLFPPTKTPLTKLSMDQRTLVLHSVLLLLLSLEHYTAPSRILMLNLTSSLKLPLSRFEQDEYTTAKGLLEAAKEMTADEETKKKAEENKESRKWRVGIATAAGAAIIGVTGGMAAPMIAAGVGSVMGGLGLGATAAAGYLGSVAGSTLLVGSLFGAYGGRMTGQMMDNYAREVEDFEFIPVHGRGKTSEDEKEGAEQASDHDHKLRVTICISGWLTEKEEVVKPWRVMGTGAEVFGLKYELESMLSLGHALDGMVKSAAWGYAQQQLIAQTIFADLASALWPIGLLKVSRVIDNPFSVAKGRAEKAGEVLADALINKAQGERPVTLIGYSLGARVIYTCLMSLAKRKAFGLIESVVMIGAPTPSDTKDWRILRSVVSGRLVNVFSENDYILGFMYRTSSIQYGVAGLQKIEGLAGVENVDVSEDVDGHLKYRYLVGSILKKIGFEDINMDAVEEEHAALVRMEKEEKKQSLQSQRKRLLRRQSTGGKEDEAAEAELEAGELEQQVQAQTQKSLTTRVIEYFYTPSIPSTKDVENVTGNVQRAAQDPSQVGAVATDTMNDVQASTQSYAEWAAKKLPSMPYMSSKGSADGAQKAVSNPSKATDKVGKTASGAMAATQSYTQKAAGYLPSMPKSLPSMPSMPSRGKQSSKPAETAKQTAETGQSAVKGGIGVAKDVIQPTVTNLTQPQNNPAVSAAKDTSKKAPIIHQATDAVSKNAPGQEKKSYLSQATDKLPGKSKPKSEDKSYMSQVTDTVSKNLPGQAKSEKLSDPSQGYLSKAAAYVPSMPTMPSWNKPKEGKKAPPKLSRASSGVKSPQPPARLDRVPSGLKSPKPSLPKLDRLPSGIKSPPKLDRIPSGIKSPPGKLERVSSGLKSPPGKLDRVPSGLKSPPTNAAKGISDGGQKAVKQGADAVGQAGNKASEAAGEIAKSIPGFGRK